MADTFSFEEAQQPAAKQAAPATFSFEEASAPAKPGYLEDIGNALRATGEKVGAAALKGAQALADVFPSLKDEGLAHPAVPQDTRSIDQLSADLNRDAAKRAPQTIPGQVAGGLAYAPLGAAAPLVMAGAEGEARRQALLDQGVDAATAGKAGLAEGALMGTVGALPLGNFVTSAGKAALAKSVASSVGKAAAVGAGQSVASDAATQTYLQGNGYDEQAKQYAPSAEKAAENALFMGAFHGGMQGAHVVAGKAVDAIAGRAAPADIAVPEAVPGASVADQLRTIRPLDEHSTPDAVPRADLQAAKDATVAQAKAADPVATADAVLNAPTLDDAMKAADAIINAPLPGLKDIASDVRSPIEAGTQEAQPQPREKGAETAALDAAIERANEVATGEPDAHAAALPPVDGLGRGAGNTDRGGAGTGTIADAAGLAGGADLVNSRPAAEPAPGGEPRVPVADRTADAEPPLTGLERINQRIAKQEAVVQAAEESLARRKAEKEASAQTGDPMLDNPASWVIRNKATGDVVMETHDPAKVAALNTDKYEAVPVAQHLREINTPDTLAYKVARGEARAVPDETVAQSAPMIEHFDLSGQKTISEADVAKALDTNRWLDRGLKLKESSKIYRGESEKTGSNTANFGRGLYSTTDRSEAAQYGEVRELDRSALPTNPIRFSDEGKFREWESYVARKVFGYRRIADFEAKHGIPDEWVRKLDPSIDGIQVGNGSHGTFFVKFPEVTAADHFDRATREQARNAALHRAVDVALRRADGLATEPIARTSAVLKLRQAFNRLESSKEDPEAAHERFRNTVENLLNRLEEKTATKQATRDVAERQRGADFLREKLLMAKRWGDIAPETADMGDWFIRQNPALVDELGLSVKSFKGDGQAPAGSYNPLAKVMTLFKGAANDTTAVHEILHHFERLMPQDMQAAIRREYLERIGKLLEDPATPQATKDYLHAALEGYASGDAKAMQRAQELLSKAPEDAYQYFNPSEFWAVNATRLMERRYGAQDSVWARIGDWLRNAVEHVKGALGLASDAPVLRALGKVMASESGKIEYGARMISDGRDFNADTRTIEVDGVRRPVYDSDGRPIARNFADQLDFWRWYGEGSVDAHGRPLAVNGEYINGEGATRPIDRAEYFDRTKPATEAADEGRETSDAIPRPEVTPEDQSRLAKLVGVPKEMLHSAASSVRQMVLPITDGSMHAMAWAKDFASRNRKAEAQWRAFDRVLEKNYTKDQLEKMWRAADEENDLRREGITDPDKGLGRLDPGERDTVELLNKYGQSLWDKAKAAGLVEGDGVAFWTPRVAARIHADGTVENLRGASPGEPSKDARNLRTSASSIKSRQHETTAESEAALKAKFGDNAGYIKNIRVMPRAMAELERAISGRTLVNQIKAHGQVLGQDLFSDTGDKNFVLIDHPALKRWQPKIDWFPADMDKLAAKGLEVKKDGVYKDGEQLASYRIKDGEVQQRRAVLDETGKPVMTSSPLYVRKDFAGPLKAVFTTEPNKVYQALMRLKGGITSLIMISPLTHNMVIWGKAFPTMATTMGWKNNLLNTATLGLRPYFVGHAVRADHAMMNDLIEHGLVPVSGRGMNPDLPAIAHGIEPGNSLLAKGLGKVGDLAGRNVGDKLRAGVDAAGHFWHETLLWDRIADMQAGMAVMMRQSLLDKGLDQQTASYLATHFANRYAGMIPREALSNGMHMLGNLALFSKSFTLTNLGAYRDVIGGLPKEVQAQVKLRAIEVQRALGKNEAEAEQIAGKTLSAAQKAARQKAVTVLTLEIAAMATVNSLVQSAMQGQSWQDIKDGFKDRLAKLGVKIKDDPLAVLGHPLEALGGLSETANNPHGKEDRVRIGEDEAGNAYYLRLPVGKVGEELKAYASPLSTGLTLLHNKLSTFVRPFADLTQNEDFQGRRIVNPDDPAIKQVAKFAAYWVKAQLPVDDAVALKHLATGDADRMDKAKLLGTATGLTVGKETGGDAVAELRYQNREQQAKLHDVLPDVREAVRRGDTDSAYDLLEQAGQTPREIHNLLRQIEQPDRMSRSALKRFNAHADDEARDKLDRLRK